MQRFKNILLYAPEDARVEPALRYAVRLAQRNAGRVTVVDCVEPVPAIIGQLMPASWKLETVVCRDRQARVDQLVEEISRQEVRAEGMVLVGRPDLEITRAVMRNGHDLVIKTAQGTAEHKEEAFFGTTAIRLMRICPCPVCVVDPAEDDRFDRILAAVDPESDEPEHAELNRKVLELSTALAEREGGTLDVVAAWTALGETILRARYPDRLQAHLDTTYAASRSRLEGIVSGIVERAPFHSKRLHLLHGDADQVILDFAEQHKIDMLVIGTLARRGLPGLLMGNTSEKILHKVRCSVLAVKLDSFVSPVKLDDEEESEAGETESHVVFHDPRGEMGITSPPAVIPPPSHASSTR